MARDPRRTARTKRQEPPRKIGPFVSRTPFRVLLPDVILRRGRVTMQRQLVRIACRTYADAAGGFNPAKFNSAWSMYTGSNP
jgi:hypothetical protein